MKTKIGIGWRKRIRTSLFFLIIITLFLIFFSSFALAIPMPTGIAGTITGDNADNSVVLIVAFETGTDEILDSNIVNSVESVEGGRFAGVLTTDGGVSFDLSLTVIPDNDESLAFFEVRENIISGSEQIFEVNLADSSSESSSSSSSSSGGSGGGSSSNNAGSAIDVPDTTQEETDLDKEDIPLTEEQWEELQRMIDGGIEVIDEEVGSGFGESELVETEAPEISTPEYVWWESEPLVLQMLLFSMVMTVCMILYLLVKRDEDEDEEEKEEDDKENESEKNEDSISEETNDNEINDTISSKKSSRKSIPLGMSSFTTFLSFTILLSLVVALIIPMVFADPTPVGITGFVIGPEYGGATINATLYKVDTSNKLASETTTTFANGSYFVAPTAPDGTSFVDIIVDVNNSGNVVTGTNGSYTNISVNDNPEINVSSHSNLTLVSPLNDIFTNNATYFEFEWNYSAGLDGNFTFQLDTDDQFLDPMEENVSGIGNATLQHNITLGGSGLSDSTYYWRVYSYNITRDLIYDLSGVFNFTLDATPPQITIFNPANISWINETSQPIILTTNEFASCRWDNSSRVDFSSKTNLFTGAETTSHTFTVDYLTISGQGENNIYIQCNDTLGNVNVSEINYTLNLDSIKPNTTSNFTVLNDTWLNFGTIISLIEDDPTGNPSSGINWTYYCTSDACDPATGTNYTAVVPIPTEGSSVFRFASSDIAGNLQSTEEVIVKIDTKAPNTTDNFSQAGKWILYDAEITLFPEDPNESLGDGSGLNWTRYCYSSEDANCVPDLDYVGTVIVADENITYFRYHSQDNVSNTQVIQTIELRIDKSNASTVSNFTQNNTWVNSARDIYLVANDTIGGRNVSGLNWTRYCTVENCLPEEGDNYSAGPITISTEGESIFRFASNDNASNFEPTRELTIKIDTEAPNTTDNFSQNDTWINFDAEITLSPEDPNASLGNGSDLNWTQYCFSSEDYNCVPDTNYTGTVTISDENITYFNYQSEDLVGNTQPIITLVVKIDKTSPSSTGASINIEGGATYSLDRIIDFAWVGFNDNITGRNVSGILRYYYNFSNEEGTNKGTVDFLNPGSLTALSEGNQTIFVWSEDDVIQSGSNIGLAVNSSIFVDTVGPTYLPINQTNITEDSGSSNFTFTINITESGSGHSFTPMYRFRYNQSANYSAWSNLTSNEGDEYELGIVSPAWGWNMNRFQNISFQINATDLAGNENISEEFLELVDEINDPPVLDLIDNQTVAQGGFLTFNVTGSDPDNDALETITLTYTANESNLTLLKINDNLLEVNWTPGNEYVGENYIVFNVSDGTLFDNQEMLINVTNVNGTSGGSVNTAPVLATIGSLNATVEKAFSYTAVAADAEGDSLNYSDNSTLFTINNTTGIFAFTPNSSHPGNYTINISVSDGNLSDEEMISLEVLTSICGDEFCSSTESCSSCSSDCGTCPAASSTSSSGGGGGGSSRIIERIVNQTVTEEVEVITEVIINEICEDNFTCFEWEPTDCTFGETQERSCYDVNGCVDLVYVENQVCDVTQSSEVSSEVQGGEEDPELSQSQNVAGQAWSYLKRGEKPALWTIFGLLLIGLLTPIIILSVNKKESYYEISDLHAMIDGHEIHIKSSVGANRAGTKGEILEQWESEVSEYAFEHKLGKV